MPGSKVNLGNGKWRLFVSNGYDVKGKAVRLSKTVMATSERDADRQLQLFYFEVKKQPVPAKMRIRFDEFVNVWWDRHGNNLSPTTIDGDRVVINTRLLPYFGRMYLSKIRAEHLIAYFKDLERDGNRLDGKPGKLSKGTVHINFRVIRAMLNKAVEWQYLSVNPCSEIPKDERPKAIHEKRPILQENELSKFLRLLFALPDNATCDKYKLLSYLDLFTGIRRGEIFALRWHKIDFDNRILYVKKSSYVEKGGTVKLKDTKTDESKRTVYLDDLLIDLFKKHKEHQEKWLEKHGITNPGDYIFLKRDIRSKEASIAHPSGFYHWLVAFLERNGISKVCVHSFRHMAASYALANNVPLTTVQAMMGHTDIATTSLYLHSLEKSRRQGAETMSGVFKNLEGDN